MGERWEESGELMVSNASSHGNMPIINDLLEMYNFHFPPGLEQSFIVHISEGCPNHNGQNIVLWREYYMESGNDRLLVRTGLVCEKIVFLPTRS